MKMYEKSKQKWNRYECWYECKNLYDWGSYKRCYLCNPNTCGCECNKPSKIHEKLFMWKCLIGKLVLGCENETLPDDEKVFALFILSTLFCWQLSAFH